MIGEEFIYAIKDMNKKEIGMEQQDGLENLMNQEKNNGKMLLNILNNFI